MKMLIHISVSTANAQGLNEALERCCAETGDVLIGQRVYGEIGEVLFVVCLMQHYLLTRHTKILNQALHDEVILSFQPEVTYLYAIQNSPYNLGAEDKTISLAGIPLYPNESWFPAINDPHKAYLCTRRQQLDDEQISWLACQKYTYIPQH